MKIKREYYCITDKYNKPDYRFLFDNQEEALNFAKKVKNSIKGETLFVSDKKRDFFVDGVKKDFIQPDKNMRITRGCWTSVDVRRVSLMDNIKAEHIFKMVKKSNQNKLAYERQVLETTVIEDLNKKHYQDFAKENNLRSRIKGLINGFEWKSSFTGSPAFAGGLATLLVIVLGGAFLFYHQKATALALELEENKQNLLASVDLQSEKDKTNETKVLGVKDEQSQEKDDQLFDKQLSQFVIEALKDFENVQTEELESQIAQIVAGSPMEQMTKMIAKKDRIVAAFLVGIAQKESNFGKRIPVLNGEDCYNYWGYRGIRQRMGSGGHTCFDSAEDAINTVARRIENLVDAGIKTPQEMVLWKCGSQCDGSAVAAGHSKTNIQKWIDDVSINFKKINNQEEITS